MADERFKGVVELPNDEAYNSLIKTGKYNDGEKEITYNPNWLYVTPNTVASNIEQQKVQIEDLYSKLNKTVTLDSVQTITGPKTFRESIYLANADGTTDRIAHINNNFIIYSGANNGVALLNIDEGLGTISAFNKQLAFKEDIAGGGGGGGTGNTTVYVANTAVEELRFDSDPQTQINAKVSQEALDKLISIQKIDIGDIILIGEAKNYVNEYEPRLNIGIGRNATVARDDVVIGHSARAYDYGNVAIGNGAYAEHFGTAIGTSAAAEGYEGVAVGRFAIVSAGSHSMQLGTGENVIDDSVQFYDDNIYKHKTHTLTVQNIELNGEDLATKLSTKLDTTGGTLTGGLSVNGNLTIIGDITQQGGSYISHAEQVYSTKDYIYLREGNTGALAEGAYTGFEFIKYDGTNNGRLVVDNKGIARVGDVGEEQPLATREEIPLDGGFAKWDATTNKFITTNSIGGYLPLTGGTITGDTNLNANLSMRKGYGVDFTTKDGVRFMVYGEGNASSSLYTQIVDIEGNYEWYRLMDVDGKLYSGKKEVAIKEDIPTSIDGMSGGTLTGPLYITGNNKNSASIVMGANGQILDGSVENYAVFGRSGGNILIGAVPYIMQMRGKNARPTYRADGGTETEMALLNDIPKFEYDANTKTLNIITGG